MRYIRLFVVIRRSLRWSVDTTSMALSRHRRISDVHNRHGREREFNVIASEPRQNREVDFLMNVHVQIVVWAQNVVNCLKDESRAPVLFEMHPIQPGLLD